jgi:predicted aspartyl protease
MTSLILRAGLLIAIAAPCAAQPVVVPIELTNNHVFVRMTSKGRDLSLLLDTGAGITLLDLPVAEALGFRLGGQANIAGAGPATVRATLLLDASITLPEDTTVKVSPRIALPMEGLNAFEGREVNGIMGADFIGRSVVQLDYAGKRLLLHDASTFSYSGRGVRVPMYLKEGHPHISAQVLLADGAQLKADCVIDIGASGALTLTKPFADKHRLAERVGPTISRKTGRGVGGSARATIGRVAALRIGEVELARPVTALYGDSAGVLSTDRNFECNIGADVLRRFTVFLDYRHKQIILEPNEAVSEPFEADMGGAAFRIDTASGGFRVTDLMPNGPGERAGLVEGDLIVAVDGRAALEFGADPLRQRLRRPGGEVEFTVRRADGDRIIRVPVRRLI